MVALPKLNEAPQAVQEQGVDAFMHLTSAIIRRYEAECEAAKVAREAEDAHNALKAFVQELKKQIRSPSADLNPIYTQIGEFIVRFSQLELFLRMAFQSQANLSNGTGQLITSQLDFRSLVFTTRGVYQQEFGDKPNWKAIDRIFKDCLKMNDIRNHIAHGSWVLQSTSSFGAVHLSRQKGELQPHFNVTPDDIRNAIAKLEQVELNLLCLLADDYDELLLS